MHIVYIEDTLQNIAELRESKYVAYWTRSMMSELQGHAPILTFFFNENIPQGVNVISAFFARKTGSKGFITQAEG